MIENRTAARIILDLAEMDHYDEYREECRYCGADRGREHANDCVWRRARSFVGLPDSEKVGGDNDDDD